MFRTYRISILAALVAVLVTGQVWASTAPPAGSVFTVKTPVSLNGVTLQPGDYTLQLNGNHEAVIYQKGREVVRARVTLKPRESKVARNTLMRSVDGRLLEVRLSDQVVVFER
jgi:hypothetical protein